jgi:uncharacterized protein
MDITGLIGVGFIMGAVGSLHCIGMCGPIAMALPMAARSAASRIYGGVIYNMGRIVTYSLLGLTLGTVGNFLLTPTIQSTISIAFGTAILLYLVLPSGCKKSVSKYSPVQGFFLNLRKRLGKLFSSGTNRSLFGIGLLNGLLPCGMIYLALTTCFITGSAVHGSLFMAAFGFGTFPAMLAVVFFGSYVNQRVRLNLRKAIPVFLACMAALLVLRGLNLGIPYISPSQPQDTVHLQVECH